MTIGGVSILLISGAINILLVLFQVLSGTRVIRVNPGVHRKTGLLLLVTALGHGTVGTCASLL
ncbi:hypothetical protein ACFL4G_09090 [Thermodesulfobacteriota bacterium]